MEMELDIGIKSWINEMENWMWIGMESLNQNWIIKLDINWQNSETQINWTHNLELAIYSLSDT